jgi:site-specific recombinase XerD
VSSLSLATAKKRFFDVLANTLRPKTVRTYSAHVESLLRFLRAHYPRIERLEQLRRRPHIEDWLRFLATRQPAYANVTRCARVQLLRRFFRDLQEWGWTRAPVADLITLQDAPPPDRYLPKPLSSEVDRAIQEGLRANNDLDARALLLARFTGVRIGELTRLERNCLSGGPHGWSIRVPLGKLHNERVVPVDEETRKLVEAIHAECAPRPAFVDPQTGHAIELLICTPSGTPLYGKRLRRRLKAIARSQGIHERVYPHRLRHTGHRTPDMTLRYADVSQDDLVRAYHKASRRIRQRYGQLTDRITQLADHARGRAETNLLAAFDDLIAQVQRARFDESDPATKKQLQRIAETMRRARAKLPTPPRGVAPSRD